MADRIDYLGGLETAGQRSESDQRAIDAKQGRFGIFEEMGEGGQVTAWQVPKAGQPVGPSPAFLGPQWSVGASPDGAGAVVLDKRTNQASFLPPGAWLIRYEGGEVVGIDGQAFAEAYSYIGEVGSEPAPRREPAGRDVNPDPGAAPVPPEPENAPTGTPAPGNRISDVPQAGPTVAGDDYVRQLQEEAWKLGYAARVHEEPLLREGREQAIRDDERKARAEGQRMTVAIDGFVDQVCADNQRLRDENQFLRNLEHSARDGWRGAEDQLREAIAQAEEWKAKAERRETYDGLKAVAETAFPIDETLREVARFPIKSTDEEIAEALVVDKAAEPVDDAEPKQEQ